MKKEKEKKNEHGKMNKNYSIIWRESFTCKL